MPVAISTHVADLCMSGRSWLAEVILLQMMLCSEWGTHNIGVCFCIKTATEKTTVVVIVYRLVFAAEKKIQDITWNCIKNR